MVSSERRRRSICPACAGLTRAPALCSECAEAFALARRAHPATSAPTLVFVTHDASDAAVADDVELWDTWSLLGDVGGRPLRCVTD